MADAPSDPALDALLSPPKPTLIGRYWKWAAVVTGLLLLAPLLFQCFGAGQKVEYLTSAVKRGDIAVKVTATGNLAPTNLVDVGSEISGIVDKVLVDVNDHVAKGQPIAVIDTSRLVDAVTKSQAALGASEASVAQAQATVDESKAQLDRLREVSRLSGGRVPSKTELATQVATNDRAVAALRSAEANVVSARAQLSSDQTQVAKAVIRSPVTGVVLKRMIDPGQTVQASFSTPSLFLIAEDLTKMKLEVSVDEADVGQVHQGQRASFTVDAYPGRTFPAMISRVNLGSKNLSGGSSSSSTTTTSSNVVSYLANLTLANADLTLRPGMTATATIETAGANNVMMVPNAALRFTPPTNLAKPKKSIISVRPPAANTSQAQQERGIGVGSHQVVYVLETGNSLRPVSVVTGQTDGRNTAVTSPELKPGMAVVTGQKASSAGG